ncbi:MAG TPA: DNA polymerase Y family protein [Myxococcaceae bacterium]|nr:DNA polymerase Y family protein [Myxococcaceae bacterium]
MRLGYLHLPRFPLQRRLVESRSWVGRPAVLWEMIRGGKRITFASQAAQGAGVRPGMTLSEATAREASLLQAPHLPEETFEALLGLGESLLTLSPAFQVDDPEGLWLDASATHLSGGEEGWGEAVLAQVESQGLQGRVVLADQAFTARALARVEGLAVRAIPPGAEAEALAPLSWRVLAEGMKGTFLDGLERMGLTTVAELASLPPGALLTRGGTQGLLLQRRALGLDRAPFVPTPLPEKLEERLSFDWPATVLEPMLFGLKTLVDRLCARLSGRRRAAMRVGLTLELEGGDAALLSISLARPTRAAKLLLELVRHRLDGVSLEAPVVALVLSVEEEGPDPGHQLLLGAGPDGEAALEVVLSRLAGALGDEALGTVALRDHHRPERAVQAEPFRPPSHPTGLGLIPPDRTLDGAGPQASPTEQSRPSRLLTPPVRLEVQLRGESLLGVRLSGGWKRTLGLAGPERLAGEWWGKDAYARDYYRACLEGVGWVWLFRDARDGGFFLHGLFD